MQDNFLHEKGEVVEDIHFIYNGIVGYVLKEHDNTVFATAEKGDYLGLVDLIPDKEEIKGGDALQKRKFNVMCLSDWCEYLILWVDDLDIVKEHHPDFFDDLFEGSYTWLKRLRALRDAAIKEVTLSPLQAMLQGIIMK